MEIPDKIISCFFQVAPLEHLIEKINSFDIPCHFFYQYAGQTYEATVNTYIYSSSFDGNTFTHHRKLNITLSHTNFCYKKLESFCENVTGRGNLPRYSVLTPKVLLEMPTVQKIKNDLDCDLLFLYSVFFRKMDLIFEKEGKEILGIYFHKGRPRWRDPGNRELLI